MRALVYLQSLKILIIIVWRRSKLSQVPYFEKWYAITSFNFEMYRKIVHYIGIKTAKLRAKKTLVYSLFLV
jgi:hypothetical protein